MKITRDPEGYRLAHLARSWHEAPGMFAVC